MTLHDFLLQPSPRNPIHADQPSQSDQGSRRYERRAREGRRQSPDRESTRAVDEEVISEPEAFGKLRQQLPCPAQVPSSANSQFLLQLVLNFFALKPAQGFRNSTLDWLHIRCDDVFGLIQQLNRFRFHRFKYRRV